MSFIYHPLFAAGTFLFLTAVIGATGIKILRNKPWTHEGAIVWLPRVLVCAIGATITATVAVSMFLPPHEPTDDEVRSIAAHMAVSDLREGTASTRAKNLHYASAKYPDPKMKSALLAESYDKALAASAPDPAISARSTTSTQRKD